MTHAKSDEDQADGFIDLHVKVKFHLVLTSDEKCKEDFHNIYAFLKDFTRFANIKSVSNN
jgi:hypothetical protein